MENNKNCINTNKEQCISCGKNNLVIIGKYQTVNNGVKKLFNCKSCKKSFSETKNTPMEHIKVPLSKVALALKLRNEGLGLRATGRVLNSNKRSISDWEKRFSAQKDTLMLYVLCYNFISLTFEGDEVYSIVNQRTKAHQSKGWTAIIMERSSRFILEQKCGKKDEALFKAVMKKVCNVLKKTKDISFFSDGERRYGNILFELCSQTLKTGKKGRPSKVLPEGLKVRIKNKGQNKHKRGPKRPKYQAPKKEHPNTESKIPVSEIHANHLEAYNASLRRRNSAFRRKTNTYAKTKKGLQRTLDCFLIFHNFIRTHWTTKKVPAVLLGIIKEGLSLEKILCMDYAN